MQILHNVYHASQDILQHVHRIQWISHLTIVSKLSLGIARPVLYVMTTTFQIPSQHALHAKPVIAWSVIRIMIANSVMLSIWFILIKLHQLSIKNNVWVRFKILTLYSDCNVNAIGYS